MESRMPHAGADAGTDENGDLGGVQQPKKR